ncbi:MAG TPA: hypothetical protein VFI34_07595 [Candidatus Limnocylindrales bacterium]|nr:hypothetical protein [Candidatus Limnocylindrales bacterium]
MPRHARSTARERQALTALAGGLASPPAPPKDLLAATIADWEAFWASEQARLVKPAHVPTLLRLFRIRDQAERFRRAGMRKPLVVGSTGQLVLNPLLKEASDLASKLLPLERDFGLTPKAWVDLGGALGDATRSLADLTAELQGDVEDAGDDDAGDDPRLLALDGGAGRVQAAAVGEPDAAIPGRPAVANRRPARCSSGRAAARPRRR